MMERGRLGAAGGLLVPMVPNAGNALAFGSALFTALRYEQ